jgi:hypothetical protein
MSFKVCVGDFVVLLAVSDGDGGQQGYNSNGGGQCVVLWDAAAVNHIHWTLCKGEEGGYQNPEDCMADKQWKLVMGIAAADISMH